MAQQSHIHLLSDEVINKIAAGEVVERPASVLKELMENSIDAGATQIEVEVVEGGKKLVSVADNGRGLNRDDAILAVERHATSKIREVEDIEHVMTLGFRGEALAAISSVSRFSLQARRHDEAEGVEVIMSGGKILEVNAAGCAAGTRITVRHLFHNVPARRKFLRADQTELAHVRQCFLLYALSHPEVGMRLVVDAREVHRLPIASSLGDRLRELFGADTVKGLREVDYKSAGVRVTGFAGLPGLHKGDRSEQYVFINGRPASAPVIGYALNEAYHTVIPKGRHAVVFLFLEVPADQVDVNVHPTKREVRFRQSSEVRDAVIGAIRKALELSPSEGGGGADIPQVRQLFTTTRAQGSVSIPDMPSLPAFTYPRMNPAEPPPESTAIRLVEPAEAAPEVRTDAPPAPAPNSPWSWCRVLGQVGGLYVVFESEDGVIIMDPHAAHERVLYEKFMREVVEKKIRTQGLLAPESVELQPEDADRVRRTLEPLREMGFGISDFGGDAFIVDALPVCLGNVSPAAVLAEIASTLDQGGVRGGTERWAETRIAQAACKAAVKANDRLKVHEIEQLVVDLARCEMPYTCPHGRPTTIYLAFQELRKKFGRE